MFKRVSDSQPAFQLILIDLSIDFPVLIFTDHVIARLIAVWILVESMTFNGGSIDW